MPNVSSLLITLILHLAYVQSLAVGSEVPSSLFKDDILFDIQWPGGYAKDLVSRQTSGEVSTTESASDSVLPELTNSIMTESEHGQQEYIEVKSIHDENFLCEMPHWSSLGNKEVRTCMTLSK